MNAVLRGKNANFALFSIAKGAPSGQVWVQSHWKARGPNWQQPCRNFPVSWNCSGTVVENVFSVTRFPGRGWAVYP